MPSSDDDSPRRVIANTQHDELLGRMIERSDMILRQSEDSRRAIDALNSTMATMRETLAKLDVTVKNIGEAMSDYHDLDSRMRAMERCYLEIKPDVDENTKFRQSVVRYGLIVAVAAVAGGGTVGNLIGKALGWH